MAWNATRLILIGIIAATTLPVAASVADAKEICLLYCPVDVCKISYSPSTNTCSCECNTLPSSTLSAFKAQKLDKAPIPVLLTEGRDGNITFLPGRPTGVNAADALQDAREESQTGNIGESAKETWEREQRERIVQGAAAANGMMRGQQGNPK
jgi:hypothetical protein